ncbi:unnamed protein product [Cylicostephanus goldi]|uniref:Uncharacterized protein n=1 Tax=Cylicostephanus goldi TaxID=71465 RepID=A0A3P7MEQ0_CYLGO|nr:unnamed protein product [Cylicostephanus goldi]
MVASVIFCAPPRVVDTLAECVECVVASLAALTAHTLWTRGELKMLREHDVDDLYIINLHYSILIACGIYRLYSPAADV